MTDKKHDKKAKAKKEEAKARKQPAKDKGELSEEQLDKVAGGQEAKGWFEQAYPNS
jgi:hypothetical protein